MGLKHRPKPQGWRGACKRRPSKLPAVGATLVVARLAHRAPLTGLVKRVMPGPFCGVSSSAGNGATTRVAPTSSLRRHEPTVIAFDGAAIPSDWPKRATSVG